VGFTAEREAGPGEAIRRWIRQETGVVLGPSSEPFERRLARIQERHGGLELQDLLTALNDAPAEPLRGELIDAATTQETSWFRDAALFDALRGLVLARGNRPLSIWSAGCAYGQEIYSVAMMLAEAKRLEGARLLATDIAPNAVERAREGRYLSLEMSRGLCGKRRDAFFLRDGNTWVLRGDLRGAVEVRRHDLREPIGETFDIILCRHVLIYFDASAQRQALQQLARALRPNGLLALGNAESLRRLDAPFRKCSIGGAAFYCPLPSMYE
jgi:chemotaxis protein methyltransferase CheR